MNRTISISPTIKKLLPNCRLGIVSAGAKVFTSSKNFDIILKNEVKLIEDQLLQHKEGSLTVIQESRNAYKICGKEPSRYRPSAEALLRRIRTGRGLYRMNNIVDTINFLSISSHFSIGGFDAANIDGAIELNIGDNQTYMAIGRGELNIEFMPALRDNIGFFGTPTSDSERTMVNPMIDEILLVYYDFGGNESLGLAIESAASLLEKHCAGTNIITSIID